MSIRILSYILFFGLLLFSCKTPSTITGVKEWSFHLVHSMEGWTISGDASWSLEDEILTGRNGVGYIISERSYANFWLEVDFYPEDGINSGIFIRCPIDQQNPTDCYEINISDNHVNQDFRTGAIVTHGKPLHRMNTIGQWNTYKIRAFDQRIQVWLNGELTADLTHPQPLTGHLALQVNGNGIIRFRNVRISEL